MHDPKVSPSEMMDRVDEVAAAVSSAEGGKSSLGGEVFEGVDAAGNSGLAKHPFNFIEVPSPVSQDQGSSSTTKFKAKDKVKKKDKTNSNVISKKNRRGRAHSTEDEDTDSEMTSDKNKSESKASSKKAGKKRAADIEDEDTDSEMSSDENKTKSKASSKKAGKERARSAKKKREVTGVAESPSSGMMRYDMANYQLYNPAVKNRGIHVDEPHSTFAKYDSYTLFMVPGNKSIDKIPAKGVRLDDLNVAIVIESGELGREQRKENWKAEFDIKGMVRGLRVPLGHAAKEFKKKGDVDIDGNVLEDADEGWYYLWYRGVHLLCGKEGSVGTIYLKRPSFETDHCKGLTFKKSRKAIVQLPQGHPDDPAFPNLPAFTKLPRVLTDLTQATSSNPSPTPAKGDPAASGHGRD